MNLSDSSGLENTPPPSVNSLKRKFENDNSKTPSNIKSSKFNKNPIFDVELGSSIGFIDLQKLEYATKTLQKNVRLILNDSPNLYELKKILTSDKLDTNTKVELEANKYVQLSASLKSKYDVGNLKIFDEILAGQIDFTEEEFDQLYEKNKEINDNTIEINLPIEVSEDKVLTPEITEEFEVPPLPTIENPQLLARVFIHKSLINSRSYLDQTELIGGHNERLEFLGDSILNNLVTLMIYNRFPTSSEGELTILRSHLIDNRTLAQFAIQYGFHKKLRASIDEDFLKTGEKKIFADIFEAYIGALGMERTNLSEVKEWLAKLYENKIKKYEAEQINLDPVDKEAKSELYSVVGTAQLHPQYIVVDEGNGVQKDFEVECRMGMDLLGTGRASSQKEAGLRAAMSALKNRPMLEKYHRIRMATDRKESAKPTTKKTNKKSNSNELNDEKKTPRSPIRTGIFPLKANGVDPLDNDAKNTLYAEIGKRIGEVPQYIITRTANDLTIVSLSIRGLVVVVATDKSKKKAMTRAAMTLLNHPSALDEICKDSFT
ncbi:uncharacterized protein RJT21DRAFT_88004 [Scheffersomyces amazonensis]|uniref:uncharacterized protein n=1 Tax=Scheffersomyces amazonensis TaxID=1078765 RepID=UPI00315C5FBB